MSGRFLGMREVLAQTRMQGKAGLTGTRRLQWRRGVVRFGQPGGRGRGERVQAGEEIGAAFIGTERRHIWQDIGRIEGGKEIARAKVSAEIIGWRLKMLSSLDSWGPHVSEEKRGNGITVREAG
jgi:hypothetical protein